MEAGTALVVGYIVGTVASSFIFKEHFIQHGIEKCLDVLIEKRMVRWKAGLDGQIDIMPLWDSNNEKETTEEDKPGC